MTAEDFHAAAAVKSLRGSQEEPAGRALAAGEILALLEACLADPTPAGYRDAAVIALLYACGPRRAELVGLDLTDVSITEDDGEHWGKLTVRHGKGNKDRSLPVAGGALDALQDWLVVRGDAAGPLFVPINKGPEGRCQRERRTRDRIRRRPSRSSVPNRSAARRAP